MSQNPKYVVIGAGLWGCTLAEKIASTLKESVLLIDRRDHLGGNCYSKIHPETDIEYHVYGTHLFHTSLDHVWQYLNQFSTFTKYRHSVYTQYKNKVYNFPVNLKTINDYYGINLKPYEVEEFIKKEAGKEITGEPQNLEEKAISLIGRPLYEAFVEGYTSKQWQTDPKELPASIITRLPIRNTYENGYFADTYEGLPVDGYYNLFNNMVKNPLIEVKLSTSWEDIKDTLDPDTFVFYSGPIDAYFGYELGRLEYRSLDFTLETKNVSDWQGCAVLNYADKETPYTRVHEFKHLHPERKEIMASPKTLICYEFSKAGKPGDELYYPVNTAPNQKLFDQYAELAKSQKNLMIAGRLGSYRYFDMDKVIDNALSCFDTFHKSLTH